MSHPLPDESFTVVPDAVEALADELATLAAQLDRGRRRRAVRGHLPPRGASAVHEGWTAGATATAWASLYELVAGRGPVRWPSR